MRLCRRHFFCELPQGCDFQNPRAAPVGARDDFARGGMHRNLVHGHGGQIVLQANPLPAAIHAGEHAKLGAAVKQIFIGHILAQTARAAGGQIRRQAISK